MNKWNSTLVAVAVCGASLLASPAEAVQTMVQYAYECDQQIGVSVPAFTCNDANATEIPGQGHGSGENDGPCDSPQMISDGNHCNPGSYVQKLHEDDDVFIYAVCRKDAETAPDRFGDIAVIQHNRDNGATCFYQRQSSLSEVESPSDPSAGSRWYQPNGSNAIYDSCPTCHDSGALIRSPFLTAIDDHNRLPWTGDYQVNAKHEPYWLVGDYYTGDAVRPVSIDADGNACTSCHRMGALTFKTGNGAKWRINATTQGSIRFGQLSVQQMHELFNPTNPNDIPIYTALDSSVEKWWMPPGRTSYANPGSLTPQAWDAAFEELKACKELLRDNYNQPTTQPLVLPDQPDCRVSFMPEIRDRPGLRVPDEGQPYRVRNLKEDDDYLYTNGFFPSGSPLGAQTPNGEWIFERHDVDVFRIKNVATGEYLCHSALEWSSWLGMCSGANPPRANWVFRYYTPEPRYYRLESEMFPNKFLHMENGALEFSMVNPAELSLWWYTDPQ